MQGEEEIVNYRDESHPGRDKWRNKTNSAALLASNSPIPISFPLLLLFSWFDPPVSKRESNPYRSAMFPR